MAAGLRPRMVMADERGAIYDHPDLLMVCRQGDDFALPRPDELMPLPEESELFLLPGRRAVGLDPETGELEVVEELAVAAFAAPAHTLTAHPAWEKGEDAPMLPLFAYGAVGFANNRFYICAKKVDDDQRQVFKGVAPALLRKRAGALMRAYPDNRLVQHLTAKCALTYSCPAARNFCLGRFEAPLPVSRTCNARCIGCISEQEKDSPICATPQNRLSFTPTAAEILAVMRHHEGNENDAPIYSFGQGCEGEPLTESALIAEAIGAFRAKGGRGTVNVNSNASLPGAVDELVRAGLTSLRVSLNSARPLSYERYYRPRGYGFSSVNESMGVARQAGLFISLNLLFFPGFSDTEAEVEALCALVREHKVDMIQLRNLNIDPDFYRDLMRGTDPGPRTGFLNFRKRIAKECPWIRFGYFNPFVPQS